MPNSLTVNGLTVHAEATDIIQMINAIDELVKRDGTSVLVLEGRAENGGDVRHVISVNASTTYAATLEDDGSAVAQKIIDGLVPNVSEIVLDALPQGRDAGIVPPVGPAIVRNTIRLPDSF